MNLLLSLIMFFLIPDASSLWSREDRNKFVDHFSKYIPKFSEYPDGNEVKKYFKTQKLNISISKAKSVLQGRKKTYKRRLLSKKH